MRLSIRKIFSFEAAHKLPNHKGKCANLHGHSYELAVTITGGIISSGSSEGMIMDFADLSEVVEKEIISKWDHKFLNDVVDFPPTAELLAQEIFLRLKKAGLPLSKVKLSETPKSFAVVEE